MATRCTLCLQEASLADDRQALAALQQLEALEGEIGAAEQEQRGRLGRGLAGCEAHLVEAAGAISRLQARSCLVLLSS